MDAAEWVKDKLRRHHVVPATEEPADGELTPAILSGTWRGCWDQRPAFGTALPFAQEMVFDGAGGISGAGTDSNGDPFHIAGSVSRDGAVTRIRWTKSYTQRLHDEVEYDGVLVGSAVAGHYVHNRRGGGRRGTFAMAQDGIVPAVARRSLGAVLFPAFLIAAFVSITVLTCVSDTWVTNALMLVWSTVLTASAVGPDLLVRRSRRQLAMLPSSRTEPAKLPPARLLSTRR